MPDNASSNPPPYMSYGVFTKAIEILAETTVPTGPLDRRVLSGFSGADYSSLISGLRFLGLTDAERKANSKFRELVEASKDKEKFKQLLLEVLVEKYDPIIGKLDLKRGTIAELEKLFKNYGVAAGQMLDRTIRFFLKAFTEAGVTPSPHMTARKPRGPRAPSKKERFGGGRQNAQQEMQDDELEIPAGFERLPLPGMPNSFIQYPVNLTEAHCQILEAMIGVLRKSVEARAGGKERKP